MNERRTGVPGEATQLPVLTAFLQAFWSQAALPAAQAMSFELALEEIFMNVVMHGSPPGALARVELSLRLDDDGVTMTLEDDGPAFDPLSVPEPDLEASLEERSVGGLGVFLVRRLMDGVGYERIGARNRLCMRKRIEALEAHTAPRDSGSGGRT